MALLFSDSGLCPGDESIQVFRNAESCVHPTTRHHILEDWNLVVRNNWVKSTNYEVPSYIILSSHVSLPVFFPQPVLKYRF